MTPEEMAEIHAAAMRVPPPWSPPTMAGFRRARGAIFVHRGRGFALGRVIADEAELLTIAVAPEAQGKGAGRALLTRLHAACRDAGAERIFLEVAETNAVARALYASAGYVEDGRRQGYYRRDGDTAIDAILMTKTL